MLEILADQASNLDYDYIYNLFSKYHKNLLSNCNGKEMFEHLVLIIEDYNNLDQGKTVL